MTDAKILSDWYRTLWYKDCISVMELLKANKSLVKVGWERDLKRSYDGKAVSQSESGNEWSGYTALHLGARTGCIHLIKQVLELYNVTIIDTDSNEDEQGAAAMSSTKSTDKTVPRPGESNLSDSEITEGKGPTTEDSRHDDTMPELDQQKGAEGAALKTGSTDTSRGARLKRVVSTIVRLNRNTPKGDKSLEKAQSSAATLEGGHTKGNLSTLHGSAGDSDSSRHPPHGKIAAQDEEINLDTSCNGSVNRKELHDLLAVRDGESGRNALTMAMELGVQEVVHLLLCAEDQCEPRNPSFKESSRQGKFVQNRFEHSKEAVREREENRVRLRDATIDFFHDSQAHSISSKNPRYQEVVLPGEEYAFHFLCGDGSISGMRSLKGLWRKVRSCEGELWRFLLQFQDTRGRTPFLVALEEGITESFEELFVNSDNPGEKDDEVVILALTSRNAAGMTPLHWAASRRRRGGVEFILKYSDKHKAIYDTCNIGWVHEMWTSYPYACNNLQPQRTFYFGKYAESPQTPLQAAIIGKNFDVAQLLIEKSRDSDWQRMGYRYYYVADVVERACRRAHIVWDVVELAFLAGITTSFAKFLQSKDLLKQKECERNTMQGVGGIIKHPYHPLHLVASIGDYKMLRFLIHNLQCDAFIEDFEGNTALHHALKIQSFPFAAQLFDYIAESQFEGRSYYTAGTLDMEEGNAKNEKAHESKIAERQGCINLLLQAGCDIFKANKGNEVPYPMDFLSTDGKFLTFWYNTQAEEFKATQNNLNFAGNAIAVTAALVATASYVGPLQPPLGYGGDFNQIQDENIWVLMVIVFDTISFYLAITAITVSLIPSLPIPQQAMRDELQRTRGMLALAVGILFPSIIFVFRAFACGSMAVVSANTISSTGGRLMVSTTCIGGFMCVLGFLLFAIRLLAFISPRNSWVKFVYGITGNIRAK